MSLISLLFSPLALIIALPIAICLLDNIIRLLAIGVGNLISSETMIMGVVCLGIVGNYVMGGALLNQLGNSIAGIFDQILVVM